ncbi:MAG: type II toxin-antitoxin system PemK/MazF family toxin [Spirosomaceae bacterium]|jgi:mRNA interferase MazF|nr:type II toxin-antitoxin system PemK/MazF family toxin [Spirosomataceae bacterium]
MVVLRFDVWLVNLDPTLGSEISKTRPCVVISPNESNKFLNTVTVAALTSTRKAYPTRVDCVFEAKAGQVALDQIRSVDKVRLVKKIGVLDTVTSKSVCVTLQDLFAYQ